MIIFCPGAGIKEQWEVFPYQNLASQSTCPPERNLTVHFFQRVEKSHWSLNKPRARLRSGDGCYLCLRHSIIYFGPGTRIFYLPFLLSFAKEWRNKERSRAFFKNSLRLDATRYQQRCLSFSKWPPPTAPPSFSSPQNGVKIPLFSWLSLSPRCSLYMLPLLLYCCNLGLTSRAFFHLEKIPSQFHFVGFRDGCRDWWTILIPGLF